MIDVEKPKRHCWNEEDVECWIETETRKRIVQRDL